MSLTRRRFLRTAAGSLATASFLQAAEETNLGFFLVGDTHYLADKDQPAQLDRRSQAVNARLIDTLNRLPGSDITQAAGGGRVLTPRGVIHAGDLIDTGDKNGKVQEQMQRREWEAYVADYGLTGADGRLKFPVYEVHGNHDGPGGTGLVIQGIIDRNRRRPGVRHVSGNGLHFSWDWGAVHCVNLGIVVGQDPEVRRRRRYNPLESLAFLVADLEKNVADTGRPIVITHHVDVARYTGMCNRQSETPTQHEWDPCDVHGYYQAIAKYNVIAVLYGHTHGRNIFKWDGQTPKAQQGIDVFNVDNSAHFNSQGQGFFYFQITDRELIAREYVTEDAWQTGSWTPQVWRRAISLAKK